MNSSYHLRFKVEIIERGKAHTLVPTSSGLQSVAPGFRILPGKIELVSKEAAEADAPGGAFVVGPAGEEADVGLFPADGGGVVGVAAQVGLKLAVVWSAAAGLEGVEALVVNGEGDEPFGNLGLIEDGVDGDDVFAEVIGAEGAGADVAARGAAAPGDLDGNAAEEETAVDLVENAGEVVAAAAVVDPAALGAGDALDMGGRGVDEFADLGRAAFFATGKPAGEGVEDLVGGVEKKPLEAKAEGLAGGGEGDVGAGVGGEDERDGATGAALEFGEKLIAGEAGHGFFRR